MRVMMIQDNIGGLKATKLIVHVRVENFKVGIAAVVKVDFNGAFPPLLLNSVCTKVRSSNYLVLGTFSSWFMMSIM